MTTRQPVEFTRKVPGQTNQRVGNEVVLTDEDGNPVNAGNPLPTTGGIVGDVTVVQPVHDQLNTNANLQVSDTDVSTTNPVPVNAFTPGMFDAFSRQRISGTGSRSEVSFTLDKQPIIFDEEISGTGAATHDANLRAVYLTTGGTASGALAALRQHFHAPYTPGSSQLIFITGNLNPDDQDWTNAHAEIGYGDDRNGVGFGYDDGGCYVFLRTSISGAPVLASKVYQANWNDPNLDVDWTTSQIFVVDFQSLDVGRVRFYMDRAGILTPVHEITNDNIRVGPYWQNPTLPPYWSVENDDVALATNRVMAICATVKSEGGPNLFDIPGYPFSASKTAGVSVSTTLIPLIALRLKTTYNALTVEGLVIPRNVELFSGANGAKIQVVLNPDTLTGGAFASAHANSIAEVNVAPTAVTVGAGRVLNTFFLSGANNGGSSGNLTGRVPLSLNSDHTVSDVLVVCAIRTENQDCTNVWAALNWEELR